MIDGSPRSSTMLNISQPEIQIASITANLLEFLVVVDVVDVVMMMMMLLLLLLLLLLLMLLM